MRRLIPPEVRQSLKTVIEYLWRDEQKNWEADSRPEDHIFHHVQRVSAWLDKVPPPSASDERKRCDACGEPFETGEEPAYEFDTYESDRPLALHPECWDAATGI